MVSLEDSRAILVVMEAEASCSGLNHEQEVITYIDSYSNEGEASSRRWQPKPMA